MTRTFSREEALSILTGASSANVKQFAEDILSRLGDISVLKNQTGLVMLPYTDSAQGTVFHLGEVLVAEAHIRLESGIEGYGMVIGRDVVFAMAAAVIDAAIASNIMMESIQTFLNEQARVQDELDDSLLRKVEATRVEMETF